MIDIVKGIIEIPILLLIFYLFGALVLRRKNRPANHGLFLVVGFFVYYFLFFVVIFPFMVKYRPLTWFLKAWLPIVGVVIVVSGILNGKSAIDHLKEVARYALEHKVVALIIGAVILAQVIIVTTTYNFTLDAAYYVANVTTTLETNMINVYDPFTGAWQDHYEVRYLFATYPINDAVMCWLFAVPALIQTKLTMSAVVIILVNVLYIMIAKVLFEDNAKGVAVMVAMMFFVNVMLYTIFTSSLFLLTRSYEGKTVIGNLSIMTIFYIFMLLINDEIITYPWLSMFLVSLGSMTISTSGNMLIPALLSVLFVPYMIVKKTLKPLPKFIACVLPGVLMLVVYVLYIEGFFVFHTYPT